MMVENNLSSASVTNNLETHFVGQQVIYYLKSGDLCGRGTSCFHPHRYLPIFHDVPDHGQNRFCGGS